MQEIYNKNMEIRKKLNKLVRRPGKNFTELFENVKTIKGSPEIQIAVVRNVINESIRFKRANLANLLEEHLQTLLNGVTK